MCRVKNASINAMCLFYVLNYNIYVIKACQYYDQRNNIRPGNQ